MKKLHLLLCLPFILTSSLLAQSESQEPQVLTQKPNATSNTVLVESLPKDGPLNRRKAHELIREAQTQAFYSEEVQTLVQNKAPWQEITSKVESVAKTIDPEAYKLLGSPFDALSQEEKALYGEAHANASKSPEIAALRKVITHIQEEIQKTMDKLTPGYEAVRNKLEDNR